MTAPDAPQPDGVMPSAASMSVDAGDDPELVCLWAAVGHIRLSTKI